MPDLSFYLVKHCCLYAVCAIWSNALLCYAFSHFFSKILNAHDVYCSLKGLMPVFLGQHSVRVQFDSSSYSVPFTSLCLWANCKTTFPHDILSTTRQGDESDFFNNNYLYWLLIITFIEPWCLTKSIWLLNQYFTEMLLISH